MRGELVERVNSPGIVAYDLSLDEPEAAAGATRILTRNGKRLEVTVPPGARDGQSVRLRNALRMTDGRDGDIYIHVLVAGSAGAGVLSVSDAVFEREVLKSSLPVLVDFWAPWCGPCRTLGPLVERLATSYQGRIKFCKLNVDENPLASRKYQVMSIPTVLLFRNGRIAGMSVGAVSEGELRGRIDAVLSGSQ